MSISRSQLASDASSLATAAATYAGIAVPTEPDCTALDSALTPITSQITSAIAAANITAAAMRVAGDPSPFLPSGTLQAVIKFAGSQNIYAGMAVQVNATSSTLDIGDPLTARYQWNFGDTTPSSQYNAYDGWSAGHLYSTPGAYTITLTITSQSGKTSTATAAVTVQSTASLRPIFISSTGNDTNNGSTVNAPIQSITRLNQLLGSNVQALFACGQTFNLTVPININAFSNVILGSYGSGALPVLNFTGPSGSTSVSTYQIITSQKGTSNLAINGLNLTSPFTAKNTPPNGFTLQGTNLAIFNCTFGNLGDDFLLNLSPNGVLIQSNTVTPGTLQGYFCFTQGSNIVIQGNKVPLPGSQYQHIVRSDGTTNLFVGFNDFETSYGCPVAIQIGSYAFIAKNTLNGPSSAGPLQGASNNPTTTWCAWQCFDSNTITDNATGPLSVGPSSWHTMLRNNIINCNGQAAITTQAPVAPWNNLAHDVRILGNTSINTAGVGRFLLVQGAADSINLSNNLSIAPNLVIGNNQSCPVYIVGTDLSSFKTIAGNIFGCGTPKSSNGQPCVEIISAQSPWQGQGFTTAAAWNALPPHTPANPDLFQNITLGPANTPTGAAAAGGISTPGLFVDFNAKPRPASGISVGAVQN